MTPARDVLEPDVSRLPGHRKVKVHEIFYSIQGESTFAGRPCVLVRLTGCQMRCHWCDTEYAFYEGDWMSLESVLEKVREIRCPLVELTGGEPLLQPGALPLLERLCDEGYEVLLETGGGIDARDVDPRVRRILDIKCPGSGEVENNFWDNLEHVRATDELKLVLADREDYEWAKSVLEDRGLLGRCPIHFSPVHGRISPRELAEWILEDRLPVRVQLQLHKILWGPEARGV